MESRRMISIDARFDRVQEDLLELRPNTLPPYSSGSLEDYDRLKGNVDKFRKAATVYDPDEESVIGRNSDIRFSPPGTKRLTQTLEELLRNDLTSTPPLDDADKDVEDMEREEREADLLIECTTVRVNRKALDILQRLWDHESRQGTRGISPERFGRLGCKLASLLLDSQRLGHFTGQQRDEDLDRAEEVLDRSLEVLLVNLQALRPFPCDTMFRIGELFIHLLKETRRAAAASDLQRVLLRRLEKELGGQLGPIPSDWPRKFETSCSRALAWCEPASLESLHEKWPEKATITTQSDDLNLKFDVRSSRFRFDEIVENVSPLHLAVIYGETDILEEMLREVEKIDVGYPELSTPLMEAARNGREDIAQMLLDKGASVKCVDAKEHGTVLHWAQSAEAGSGVGVAKLFLRAEAASLLEQNQDADGEAHSLLEMEDVKGKTALYLACEMKNRKMVELLVKEYHANVDAIDMYGKTALHATVDTKDDLEEKSLKVAQILLKAGANPNTSDNRDDTPLFIACSLGNVKVVELLLKYEADPNRPGQNRQTPLIAATRHNHAGVVMALMRKGATPHLTDMSNLSADDYAKRNPTSEINVKQLLRRSYTPSQRRDSGRLSVQSAPLPLTNTQNGTAIRSRPRPNSTATEAADATPSRSSGTGSSDAASRTSSNQDTSRS